MKKIILISALIFLAFSSLISAEENEGILVGTRKNGIFKKYVKGNEWLPINNGLPKINGGNYPEVKGIYPVNSREFYCILNNYGIYYTNDGGNLWVPRNKGLPLTCIKNTGDERRFLVKQITSFSIHPLAPKNIILTTKFDIFYSNDGAETWHVWDVFQRKSNFFVASAFVPVEELNALIGTAYNGLFSCDFHREVKLVKGEFPKEPYDKWQSIFFHEEIQSILISRFDNDRMFVGTGFGNGLWYSSNGGKNWKLLPFKIENDSFFNIFSIQEQDENTIIIESDSAYYQYNYSRNEFGKIDYKKYFNSFPVELRPVYSVWLKEKGNFLFFRYKEKAVEKSRFFEKAKEKNAIYVTAFKANIDYFKKNLDDMKKKGINAVIIECKDDFGRVMYDSQIPEVEETGAEYRVIKIREVIDYLHENGIYVGVRIIVFKDKKLFEYDNNKYAIWNKSTDKPWQGIKKEYWVDPFSDFVQNYNLNIAKELEKIGADEIQFDYIRFPTDGPIDKCYYRYRVFDMDPVDAIASFLYKARKTINIPISIDVYGFNSWYRMGKVMGQDIETLSEFVDVICPMLYPSHFGDYFLKKMFPNEYQRAEKIIYLGSKRCSIISDEKIIVRPYLQAFNYKSPGYNKKYIEVQIKGAEESGASGFTLWNPSANYSTFFK